MSPQTPEGEINPPKADEAQREYCKFNNLPNFTPPLGRCTFCNKQIYELISVEKARTDLITGCPHCHHTFCD